MLLMEGKEIADYRKGLKKEAGMRDLLKKKSSQFQFFSYNSSLFPDNSLIRIERYENQIVASEKKTKIKVPSEILEK
jgi:hypothetical protein